MRTTIFALFLLLACAAFAAPVTLVKNGVPTSCILLSAEPTRAAQLAAFELQWHVQQMTGAELPIVREGGDLPAGTRILVGESLETRKLNLTSARFADQEYLVRAAPDTLVLIGKDRADYGTVTYNPARLDQGVGTWPDIWHLQGTLHAVYDLLEQWGVCWLNPTDTGTVIPQKTTLSFSGKDVRRKPFFRYRYGTFVTPDPAAYDTGILLWPGNTPQYKAYEQAAYADLHARFTDAGTYAAVKRAIVRLYWLRNRVGGEKCMANHSMYGFYDRFWDEKSPIFAEKRPEFFAKGYPNEGEPPQLCYTNPDLIKQLTQDARDYFNKGGYSKTNGGRGTYPGYHWGEKFFCIEPMDNSAFCKCPECAKLTAQSANTKDGVYSVGRDSNYMFSFVNAVAGEVKKTNPDQRIVTLAYASHAFPPTAFKLDPDIAVQYCFASNRSPWERRNYENDLAALKAWREEDPDRPLYLWLYYTFPVETANNGKWFCFPGFFAHTIDEQMKLFQKYNLQGMFHCGYGQEVEAYVTYKQMDNPSLKIDDILNDYFTGLYGPAAKPMRQLYEGIERVYSDPKNRPTGKTGVSGMELSWGYLGNAERMAAFQKLLDQAKQLAVTERDQRNIDLFEKSTWSYMVTGRETYVRRAAAPIPNTIAPRVPDAGGDVAKVDWTKAAPLPGSWFDRGQEKPSARKFAGRVAHDGTNLYLELTDPCDTTKLVTSPNIFPFDDWEVFVGKQRALPYRQFACGPTGLVTAISHGEVNWRMNVPIENPGVKAIPTLMPDKWVTRMVLPLATAVPGGVQPGGKLYMNILRVTSPGIAGQNPYGIDTWVSYSTVHEVDRLAEIALEK